MAEDRNISYNIDITTSGLEQLEKVKKDLVDIGASATPVAQQFQQSLQRIKDIYSEVGNEGLNASQRLEQSFQRIQQSSQQAVTSLVPVSTSLQTINTQLQVVNQNSQQASTSLVPIARAAQNVGSQMQIMNRSGLGPASQSLQNVNTRLQATNAGANNVSASIANVGAVSANTGNVINKGNSTWMSFSGILGKAVPIIGGIVTGFNQVMKVAGPMISMVQRMSDVWNRHIDMATRVTISNNRLTASNVSWGESYTQAMQNAEQWNLTPGQYQQSMLAANQVTYAPDVSRTLVGMASGVRAETALPMEEIMKQLISAYHEPTFIDGQLMLGMDAVRALVENMEESGTYGTRRRAAVDMERDQFFTDIKLGFSEMFNDISYDFQSAFFSVFNQEVRDAMSEYSKERMYDEFTGQTTDPVADRGFFETMGDPYGLGQQHMINKFDQLLSDFVEGSVTYEEVLKEAPRFDPGLHWDDPTAARLLDREITSFDADSDRIDALTEDQRGQRVDLLSDYYSVAPDKDAALKPLKSILFEIQSEKVNLDREGLIDDAAAIAEKLDARVLESDDALKVLEDIGVDMKQIPTITADGWEKINANAERNREKIGDQLRSDRQEILSRSPTALTTEPPAAPVDNSPGLLEKVGGWMSTAGMYWGRHAEGGIVDRPTVSLLGEQGPEVVIPLSKLGSDPGIHKNLRSVLSGKAGYGIDSLPHLQEGGVIQQPTVVMAGEAGPEAIMPLNAEGSTPITQKELREVIGEDEGWLFGIAEAVGDVNDSIKNISIGETFDPNVSEDEFDVSDMPRLGPLADLLKKLIDALDTGDTDTPKGLGDAPAGDLPKIQVEVPDPMPKIGTDIPGELPKIETDIPTDLPKIETIEPNWFDKLKIEIPDWFSRLKIEVPDWFARLKIEVPDWFSRLKIEVPDWFARLKIEVPDWFSRLKIEVPDWFARLKIEVPDWFSRLKIEVPDWFARLKIEVPDWFPRLKIETPTWFNQLKIPRPSWLNELIGLFNRIPGGGGTPKIPGGGGGEPPRIPGGGRYGSWEGEPEGRGRLTDGGKGDASRVPGGRYGSWDGEPSGRGRLTDGGKGSTPRLPGGGVDVPKVSTGIDESFRVDPRDFPKLEPVDVRPSRAIYSPGVTGDEGLGDTRVPADNTPRLPRGAVSGPQMSEIRVTGALDAPQPRLSAGVDEGFRVDPSDFRKSAPDPPRLPGGVDEGRIYDPYFDVEGVRTIEGESRVVSDTSKGPSWTDRAKDAAGVVRRNAPKAASIGLKGLDVIDKGVLLPLTMGQTYQEIRESERGDDINVAEESAWGFAQWAAPQIDPLMEQRINPSDPNMEFDGWTAADVALTNAAYGATLGAPFGIPGMAVGAGLGAATGVAQYELMRMSGQTGDYRDMNRQYQKENITAGLGGIKEIPEGMTAREYRAQLGAQGVEQEKLQESNQSMLQSIQDAAIAWGESDWKDTIDKSYTQTARDVIYDSESMMADATFTMFRDSTVGGIDKAENVVNSHVHDFGVNLGGDEFIGGFSDGMTDFQSKFTSDIVDGGREAMNSGSSSLVPIASNMSTEIKDSALGPIGNFPSDMYEIMAVEGSANISNSIPVVQESAIQFSSNVHTTLAEATGEYGTTIGKQFDTETPTNIINATAGVQESTIQFSSDVHTTLAESTGEYGTTIGKQFDTEAPTNITNAIPGTQESVIGYTGDVNTELIAGVDGYGGIIGEQFSAVGPENITLAIPTAKTNVGSYATDVETELTTGVEDYGGIIGEQFSDVGPNNITLAIPTVKTKVNTYATDAKTELTDNVTGEDGVGNIFKGAFEIDAGTAITNSSLVLDPKANAVGVSVMDEVDEGAYSTSYKVGNTVSTTVNNALAQAQAELDNFFENNQDRRINIDVGGPGGGQGSGSRSLGEIGGYDPNAAAQGGYIRVYVTNRPDGYYVIGERADGSTDKLAGPFDSREEAGKRKPKYEHLINHDAYLQSFYSDFVGKPTYDIHGNPVANPVTEAIRKQGVPTAPGTPVYTPTVRTHQLGTSFAPGGLSLVGEAGPELVEVPRGSNILSNPQTMSKFQKINKPTLNSVGSYDSDTILSSSGGGGGNSGDFQQEIIVQLDGREIGRTSMDYFDKRVRVRGGR